MESFLEVLGTFLGGSVAGYLLKHWLDRKLQEKGHVVAAKREVYDQAAAAMTVFLEGARTDPERRDSFLQSHARMWVWGPDSVIRALNEYLDLNAAHQRGEDIDQGMMKDAFARCILELRRDLAFPNTELDVGDYRAVSFGD